MTVKSKSRRERDAQLRLKHGKVVNKTLSREKTSLAWYELKRTHARTQQYIVDLAERTMQYANITVVSKIITNGDKERFDFLMGQIKQAAGIKATDFEELYNSHKDKTGRCTTMSDVEAAMVIFGNYEKFDTDFFTTFQPLISELNQIFNKALEQLLDAQDKLRVEMANDAKSKMLSPIADGSFYEDLPSTSMMPLPKPVEDLVDDSPVKARGQTSVSAPIDDLAFVANHPGATTGLVDALQATGAKIAVLSIDPADLPAEQKVDFDKMLLVDIPKTWDPTVNETFDPEPTNN